MVTRNHSTNGTYIRRGHIKTALEIGQQTRPRLISVSPRYIFSLEYVWHCVSLAVSLATDIRVLKPE